MAKKSQAEEMGASAPPSLQDIANAFFAANPHYSAIVICDDGVVFEDSASGKNAAANHADSKNPKLNFQHFHK